MRYKIVDMPQQKFLAVTRDFSIDFLHNDERTDIPDFWDECKEKRLLEKLLHLRPVGKKDLYGLCTPPEEDDTTFEYGIGIRVDDATEEFFLTALTPNECKIWTLEPSKYVVFECVGNNSECIAETWAKFYTTFLPNSEYRVTRAPDFEVYPETEREGIFCELWIPIESKRTHR